MDLPGPLNQFIAKRRITLSGIKKILDIARAAMEENGIKKKRTFFEAHRE